MEQKFYICKHCGNIIEKVKDKGVPVVCCGEVMQEPKLVLKMELLKNMYQFIQ